MVRVGADGEGERAVSVAGQTPSGGELIVGMGVSGVRVGARRGYLGHAKARPLSWLGREPAPADNRGNQAPDGGGAPGGATVEAVPSGAASLSL